MRDSSKIELQIFFVRCVAAVDFLVLRDRWAGETLIRETYKCGSPPAPRKASIWNGNQPLSHATNRGE
ncbi:hypothetical protein AWM68_12580 [Fictibacillus phosphorivorans]|uniref:Uncharacterized protein n=1 Tax=Fictibacillus phosphorivorans TaxID=1221500 RepID=A0A168CSH2_9BACL|nr:hypothetical protein AWM68_12580 [Fictibacillus phosphorivorans]